MNKSKILYISTPHFLDADLMLLKHIVKYVDMFLLLDVANYSRQSNLLNIKKVITKSGLYTYGEKSHLFPPFFKNYINYDKSNVILRSSKKSYHLSNIKLQIITKKFIQKINPDIIHFNNYVGLNLIYPFSYSLKFKNVLTIHDLLAHSGEKNSRVEKIKKTMIRCSDRLILLNNQNNEEFRNNYNVKKQKTSVTGLAPYFIYKNLLNSKANRINNSILFFGRISPYKGIEYLIEASKIASEKIEDLNITIAGKGKFNFNISEIMKDCKFNIINRYIENEELAELIASHSVIVCPYTDATQSGVLMTAYAFNKPVIATSVGNFPNLISNNITGLIVPPMDSQALANAIVTIFSNPELISEIENNIKIDRQLGSESWEGIAEKTFEIYKSVLEKK